MSITATLAHAGLTGPTMHKLKPLTENILCKSNLNVTSLKLQYFECQLCQIINDNVSTTFSGPNRNWPTKVDFLWIFEALILSNPGWVLLVELTGLILLGDVEEVSPIPVTSTTYFIWENSPYSGQFRLIDYLGELTLIRSLPPQSLSGRTDHILDVEEVTNIRSLPPGRSQHKSGLFCLWK